MPVDYQLPFFEIDFVARSAWPLGMTFQPKVQVDFAVSTHAQQALDLRRGWREWPTLSAAIAIAERLAHVPAGCGAELVLASPSAAYSAALFATPMARPGVKMSFSIPPFGSPAFAWINRRKRDHNEAIAYARSCGLVTGNADSDKRTQGGEAAEEGAHDGALAFIKQAINAPRVWHPRGAQSGMGLPPVVRVVGYDTQVIVDSHRVGQWPAPGALSSNTPLGALPDIVRIIDQLWVFQLNTIRTNDKGAVETAPNPKGAIMLVGVEIDGDYKWNRVSPFNSQPQAEKETLRSRQILGHGLELFRIDADDCKRDELGANEIAAGKGARSAKDKAFAQFEHLWQAVNERLFSWAFYEAHNLIYATDHHAARYVDRAVESQQTLAAAQATRANT
ncbi:hypothetical protein, partial [Burkholderia pseudomallei]|uniref:hypothetical protein n=1 Tax=Burkholderia pseudomallei TaxID=28450 RepID=UPI0011C4AEE5